MANPEHVAVVRQGKEATDEWRKAHPGERLDLSGADLSGANLMDADLRRADLIVANLGRADLTWAHLSRADLFGADLTGADLTGANLIRADLTAANLSVADLGRADLTFANFRDTNLKDANVSQATFAGTSLGGVDVSQAMGLKGVKHEIPSHVGVDTLMASFRGAGNKFTPDLLAFFRGAGVPQELLDALPAILAEVKYHTCFIAYGQPDLAFAQKLYKDLEGRGVSCWLYAMDATPGERTWREIGQKRRESEKMVILCSAKALVRDGVLKEIEEQIDEDPDKMVPISLEKLWKVMGFSIMRGERDLKRFLVDRNYADFAKLPYEAALERLLAGLRRRETAAPTPLVEL
ncbi:MAG: toll/interleukin-1 receptor domain-containing protein [Dehalococcoidia bacterium]|nr:toll/interleukin-1 receptor domain-containing protein [Dehalococcoidia bacterium]